MYVGCAQKVIVAPPIILNFLYNCSHSGATYRICHMVAETISVKCTEHSYQHSASDLALILCTFVI